MLGATGTIGRLVAHHLEESGHHVRRVSRSTGVDVLNGQGLDVALAGADAVVDCLNVVTLRARTAIDFFTRAAAAVARSAGRVGVRRIVCVSIAGATDPQVNRGYGYYRAKAAQEQVYTQSPVPTTIIHSTQWFELVPQIVGRTALGPVAVIPTMRMAPIAADRVARLVVREIEAGHEGDRTSAIRGPQELTAAQAARTFMAVRGEVGGRRPRVIWELPLLGRGIAGGGLIPGDGLVDDLTLEEWLQQPSGA